MQGGEDSLAGDGASVLQLHHQATRHRHKAAWRLHQCCRPQPCTPLLVWVIARFRTAGHKCSSKALRRRSVQCSCARTVHRSQSCRQSRLAMRLESKDAGTGERSALSCRVMANQVCRQQMLNSIAIGKASCTSSTCSMLLLVMNPRVRIQMWAIARLMLCCVRRVHACLRGDPDSCT